VGEGGASEDVSCLWGHLHRQCMHPFTTADGTLGIPGTQLSTSTVPGLIPLPAGNVCTRRVCMHDIGEERCRAYSSRVDLRHPRHRPVVWVLLRSRQLEWLTHRTLCLHSRCAPVRATRARSRPGSRSTLPRTGWGGKEGAWSVQVGLLG
jgi:hypothetical protein